MATYYRWRKSTIRYRLAKQSVTSGSFTASGGIVYFADTDDPDTDPEFNTSTGKFSLTYDNVIENGGTYRPNTVKLVCGGERNPTEVYGNGFMQLDRSRSTIKVTPLSSGQTFNRYYSQATAGTSQGYVYSTSSSAYPNGGVSGSYYYDQRTTVTSPTAPTGLTYPATITTPSVSVSWTAATSATNYPVSLYEVSYSTNGGSSWTVAGTTAEVSYTFSITPGTTSIMFRVRAQDSNGQWGGYVTGTASQVLLAPTLTVPQMVMQGQQATISWSAIEGADSYTLQRKSSADADWTQVYSGANQSYTETVGTWTSVQYRVQAVFSGTPGGWAESAAIPVVSSSALVISGTDGDLGTLVNDVPYSISSDQTSPTIDVTVEVNGGEYASFQATSGQTYKVGVLDLPTGTGSIVITASTTVSESPVTVTRTWTYSKTAQTFPNSGSVATLTKEGNVVYPETLIEAVRASMTPWGGNLSTALNLLKNAALFNQTKQPKYSEVTVSLSGKAEVQTIQLPENGRMVEFYVAKLDYESALNGAGRILLVRKDCYDLREWDAGNVNAYATSDIDSWMNSTYKALFPEEIQTAMGTTKFYYTPGNGNTTVTTLERAVFLLSATELGKSNSSANVEGSSLLISSILNIAYLNGEAVTQWTRSPQKINTGVGSLSENGYFSFYMTDSNRGSRPCFTLPSTFSATYYVAQDGTIHESQEYTEAGEWRDVWGNAIPAVKIETGSYVGTGTSGSSNPTSLTFLFEPKIVFIARGTTPSGGSLGTITPMIRGVQKSIVGINGNSISIAYLTWDNNSLSFYGNGGADTSLNESGITYHYVAIG